MELIFPHNITWSQKKRKKKQITIFIKKMYMVLHYLLTLRG